MWKEQKRSHNRITFLCYYYFLHINYFMLPGLKTEQELTLIKSNSPSKTSLCTPFPSLFIIFNFSLTITAKACFKITAYENAATADLYIRSELIPGFRKTCTTWIDWSCRCCFPATQTRHMRMSRREVALRSKMEWDWGLGFDPDFKYGLW